MYSTLQAKERALKEKTRKAKIQAKAQHPDFKNKHPSEARDAASGKYTELEKRIKDEHQKHMERQQLRREKLGGDRL